MNYLMHRARLRWKEAPRRMAMFFVQAFIALFVVTIALGNWANLWRQMQSLRTQSTQIPYVLMRTDIDSPAEDTTFYFHINQAQAAMIQTEFSDELELCLLYGRYEVFDNDGQIVVLPVFLGNRTFFESYLGLSAQEIDEGAVMTPNVLALFKQGMTLRQAHDNGIYEKRIAGIQRGQTELYTLDVPLPRDLYYASRLQNYLNTMYNANMISASGSLPFVPENGAIYMLWESVEVAGIGAPERWQPATSLLLNQGVTIKEVAPRLLPRLAQLGDEGYNAQLSTSVEAYIQRTSLVWDNAVESGVWGIVLLALVSISLIGWCLSAYHKRVKEYTLCLCTGATRFQIVLEMAVELWPVLLFAAILGLLAGHFVLFSSSGADGFAFEVVPWVILALPAISLAICALAVLAPAIQLRRLTLSSLLKGG